jgi:predicted RNase H-like HicB family nuclease
VEVRRYTIIYERTGAGYGAHVPDLPGCIATGRTLEQTKLRMAEAIQAHLEGMREDGTPIPEPTTEADVLEVA